VSYPWFGLKHMATLSFSKCLIIPVVFFWLTGATCAEPLSLEQITQNALTRSFELKISAVDLALAKNEVKAARVDYFPVIRGNLNTEYQHSLQSQPSQVTTINNIVLPTGTRYQNSIGLNLNHTLLDFGARHYKLASARQGVTAKTLESARLKRELQLKLLDLYTDALISYKSKKAHEALFQLAQQQYLLKRRLQEAGHLSSVPAAEEAIQMAQHLDSIQVYNDQLAQKLQSLSYYTQDHYEAPSTELTDLVEDTPPDAIRITVTKSPDAHLYDALIAQKLAEISALKRQALPTVSWYSYYSLYGFNPDSWGKSVTDLSQRTVSVGLSVNLPIFDGFKNQTAIERVQLEKQKLQLQKEEKLAQLQNQADGYQQQADGYGVELKTKAVILNKTQDKLSMLTRLTEQKVVDSTQAVQEHMSRIQKQLDVEKSIIQHVAAVKKLKILAEGSY
jgi:outer membrane protein